MKSPNFDLDNFFRGNDFINDFILFRDYLEVMEGFLLISEKKAVAKLEGEKNFNWKIVNYDYDYDELLSIYLFGNLLRQNFFVGLFSWIETALINECRKLGKSNEKKESFDSFKDKSKIKKSSSIDQAKRYLLDIHKYPFDSHLKKEWDEIKNYQKLRNCIVHNGGNLEDCKYKDQIVKFIKNKKNLRLITPNKSFPGEDKVVELLPGFCEEAIEVTERFFRGFLFG